MWKDIARATVATGLWFTGFALMTARTFGDGAPELTGWAIIFSLGGCTFTGWHLLVMERTRVEELATLGACAALQQQGLSAID